MPKIDRHIAVIEDSSETTVHPGDATNKAVRVNVVAGSASGASKPDNSTFTEDTDAVAPLGALVDETTPRTIAEGKIAVARMSPQSILLTEIRDQSGDSAMDDANNAVRVNIVAGAGSGGTAMTDEAAFTEATTSFTPIGGVFNDALASDPTAGQAAAARITSDRALHTNLRSASGTEIATAGAPLRVDPTGTTAQPVTDNSSTLSVDDGGGALTVDGTVAVSGSVTVVDGGGTLSVDDGGSSLTVDGSLSLSSVTPGTGATDLGKAEDAAHTSGDVGVMSLAVRKDARGALAGTDGDYSPFQLNASGDLRVDASAVAVPVTDNSSTLSVDDGGSSLTVDGTVAVSSIAAGNNNIGDVDVASLPSTTVAGATAKTADFDTGAGSDQVVIFGLACPNAGGATIMGIDTCPVRTDPTGTTAQPVTDNGSTLSVDDGGASLTVDGTVAVSGTVTVDSELPTAAASADGAANPTAPAVRAANELFNNSTWDRQRNNYNVASFLTTAASTTIGATFSANQTNYNHRGLILFVYVTAVGATGIRVRLQGFDPGSSGLAYNLNNAFNINATGLYCYTFYPGATFSSTGTQVIATAVNTILPRTWRVRIDQDDTTSTSYEISATLIL